MARRIGNRKVVNMTITNRQRGGAYADVVEFLASIKRRYGSLVNAAAQVIRGSTEYADWAKAQPKRKAG
jgi:hypothetical protein